MTIPHTTMHPGRGAARKRARNRSALLSLFLAPILAACGGSSSTEPTLPPAPPPPPPPPPAVMVPEVLNEAITIGAAPAPVVGTFDVAAAGSYTLTVADTGTPGGTPPLLERLNVAIVQNGEVQLRIDGSDSQSVTLEAGEHSLHVVGVPDAAARVGAATVAVADGVGASLIELASTFEIPDVASGPANYQVDFDITAAGSYELVVEDFALPETFSNFDVILVRLDDLSVLPPTTAGNATSFTFTQAGTYQLTVSATLSASTDGGLYGINLSNTGTAATILSEARIVGVLPEPAAVEFPASADYSVVLADFAFPAALADLRIAVVADGRLLAGGGAGSQAFTAPAGAADVYVNAVAADPPGAGSYGMEISDLAGAVVFETVSGVEPQDPRNNLLVANSVVDITAPGSYTLTIRDVRAPVPLTTLSAIVSTGGNIVETLSAAGSVSFDAIADRYELAIFAETPQADDSGLLAVELTSDAGGDPVFAETIAVGAELATRTASITTSGDYVFTLTDSVFPVSFSEVTIIVTQGASFIGDIRGDGSLPVDDADGDYLINILTRPDPADGYGTFAIRVGDPESPAP